MNRTFGDDVPGSAGVDADATAMAAGTQAQCLRMLERAHFMGTAARTSVLAAFISGQGYSADADYSPRAWLINRTRVTRGAGVGYTAWVRRAAAHPQVAAALAAGEIYARSRSGKPDEDRDQAFGYRSVRLEATFGGAGVLHGDLTPECASVVTTVLDALSAPAGVEDTRSQAQRFHDGLQEAMR